jgi:hypothetical protein
MEFLSIREFNASPRTTREKLKREGKLVLTNHGKPMALVLSVDGSTLEETLEIVRCADDMRKGAGERVLARGAESRIGLERG